MMTISQIKAARALLDWTQADLARAAGLHLNVVNNTERGTANPRQGTLEKIQAALEGNGIALIGNRGVELRRDIVSMLRHEGEGFIRALTVDIVANTPSDGEVLSILPDIRNFSGADPEANKAYQEQKSQKGFGERLVTRDMPGFYPRNAGAYRVLAVESLGPVDTIIYGDRVAHIFWNAQEVVILKNADLAATQRRVFEQFWTAGHEPVRAVRAAED